MVERIPYYRVKNGNGFWEPGHRMLKLGFASVACGPDGEGARAVARAWNERWQAVRRSVKMEPETPGDKLGYVYFLRVADRVKVGFSRNPFTRTGEMKTGISAGITAMAAVRGSKSDEAFLHRRLAAFRQAGEWFVASAIVLKVMHRTLAFGSVERVLACDERGTAADPLSEQDRALVGMTPGPQ